MFDLVSADCVLPALKATSKKQALQEIAARAGEVYRLDTRRIVDGLLAREKLGSTAMGGGVAIPHTRLDGLTEIKGVFARLDKPVEFEAADGMGVDLIFVLLAPVEAGADHLRALARVSRLFRDTDACTKLRATSQRAALHALLTEITTPRAA